MHTHKDHVANWALLAFTVAMLYVLAWGGRHIIHDLFNQVARGLK